MLVRAMLIKKEFNQKIPRRYLLIALQYYIQKDVQQFKKYKNSQKGKKRKKEE